MDIELTVSGPFLKSEYSNINDQETLVQTISKDIISKFIKEAEISIKTFIQNELERSVELSTYMTQRPDQEVIKTLIRSVKVKYMETNPPSIDIEYKDELGHWYGGQELPQELLDMISKHIDTALEKWYAEQKRTESMVIDDD